MIQVEVKNLGRICPVRERGNTVLEIRLYLHKTLHKTRFFTVLTGLVRCPNAFQFGPRVDSIVFLCGPAVATLIKLD